MFGFSVKKTCAVMLLWPCVNFRHKVRHVIWSDARFLCYGGSFLLKKYSHMDGPPILPFALAPFALPSLSFPIFPSYLECITIYCQFHNCINNRQLLSHAITHSQYIFLCICLSISNIDFFSDDALTPAASEPTFPPISFPSLGLPSLYTGLPPS